jgi:putative flippase GtrA
MRHTRTKSRFHDSGIGSGRAPLLGQLSRFGLAGIVNTGIGLAVILALDLGLGVNPQAANAAGFAVGIATSFALSRGFVFRHRGTIGEAGARYVAATAAAFVLNQGVLAIAGWALDDGALARTASQLAAMAAYTVTLFLLCRRWVFGT